MPKEKEVAGVSSSGGPEIFKAKYNQYHVIARSDSDAAISLRSVTRAPEIATLTLAMTWCV